jgi:putative flippase GtrA
MWQLLKDQRLLFIASGGLQYVLDVVLFALLITVNTNYLVATAFSRVTVGCTGFCINGFLVFKTLKGKNRKAVFFMALRFFGLLGGMTMLSVLLMKLAPTDDNLQLIIYKIVIEAILAVMSFIMQKFLVF